MKNIYNDDSFSKDSKDVFSKSSYDFIKEFNQMNPEKPKTDINVDFTQNVPAPAPAPEIAEEPKRQAPPPIKRTAPPVQPQTPPAAYYTPAGAYPGQPVYPYPAQPVYYPVNPGEPMPVFVAPGQPYPAYPQGYPVQPGAYPVQQPYPGQPVYAQPPVMQVPSAPYPQAQPQVQPTVQPQQPTVQPAAPVATDPMSKEAGTRVLFQSPDFDTKNEDTSADGTDEVSYDPAIASANLDISEVDLPSRKRAGSDSEATSFRIDEMEIGTYELSAMSIRKTSKVTGLDAPVIQPKVSKPVEPGFTETDEAEEITEEENLDGIFPKEIIEEEKKADADKKVSPSEIIRRAILGISIIAIIVSGFMLYKEYKLHKDNENAMSSISDLIITEEEVTEPSTEKPDQTTNKNSTTTTRPTTTKFLTPSEQFELLKKQNPDIVFPDNIQLKYAKLYAENQDFVGYLRADGTDIDFPIVQGKDDDEYLEKSFFGEYTKYGCPFMTYRNNPKNLDMNTVIYGHNMLDGSLFATLEHYLTLDGYKKAPIISYNTLFQDLNFKVIAVMITNAYPEDDNGYVFPYYWANLSSSYNYTAYLNQLSQRSLYDTGVDVLPTDRLLTLSTCYDEFDDSRLVVVARLVRPGESTTVDTSKAVKNENPRFPQAYYDEHRLTNPYANAYKWTVT